MNLNFAFNSSRNSSIAATLSQSANCASSPAVNSCAGFGVVLPRRAISVAAPTDGVKSSGDLGLESGDIRDSSHEAHIPVKNQADLSLNNFPANDDSRRLARKNLCSVDDSCKRPFDRGIIAEIAVQP